MYEGVDIDSVMEELRDALRVVPAQVSGVGGGPWTRAVKDAVVRVARSELLRSPQSSHICANRCEGTDGDGEWLFDLTWYLEEVDWRMRRLVLVMESEWSLRDVERKTDFQKLLVAKAPLKLFVFQGAGADDAIAGCLREFAAMIDAYEDRSTSEHYLFAALDFGPEVYTFVFKRYDWASGMMLDW